MSKGYGSSGDGRNPRGSDNVSVMQSGRLGDSSDDAADKFAAGIDPIMRADFQNGLGGLTPEEITSIDYYTSDGYETINAQLRAGGTLSRGNQLHQQRLDAAIAKGRARRPYDAYRGMELDPNSATAQAIIAGKKGTVIRDNGYSSTTMDPVFAREFAQNGSGGNVRVVARVHVPRGSRALYVAPHSQAGASESELLLPRGTQYRIKNVHKARGGIYEVDMDVVNTKK